jgi:hypothetical protein
VFAQLGHGLGRTPQPNPEIRLDRPPP